MFKVSKKELAKKVLKHSEEGNLENANELLEEYTNREDTTDKEIEEVIKKALIKAQKREE